MTKKQLQLSLFNYSDNVKCLVEAGFTEDNAQQALHFNDDNLDKALQWLLKVLNTLCNSS